MFLYFTVFILGLLYPNVASEFYYPDCEYSGMSCIDCYSQKLCINFFGLTRWSVTSCASDVAGYTAPYCNPETDACTNVRPEGCASVSYLKCLREGRFPDTSDCSMFYECADSTTDSIACPKNYIYRQEYGKCVFKLSNNDCVKLNSCGFADFVEQYPTDPSFYYGCTASKMYLKACGESEIYNTTTKECETKCTKVGLIPFAQNCSKYFSCQEIGGSLIGVEQMCADGYGFNPNSLKCESGYAGVCNELSLLENDFYDILSKIPIIRKLSSLIQKVFNLLSLNPVKILFIFRISDDDLSTFILVLDYIYKNKSLPSTSITLIISYIYDYLPAQAQFVLNLLSQFGILRVTANNRVARSISEEASLDTYLEDVLSNIEIDIVSIIENIEGKNATELSNDIFQQLVKVLKIPEDRIPQFTAIMKDNMPHIANFLNKYIGWPVFVGSNDGLLRIDAGVVDQTFNDILKIVTPILYPNSYFLAKIFQVTAKQQYFQHHSEIIVFIKNFYFNIDDI